MYVAKYILYKSPRRGRYYIRGDINMEDFIKIAESIIKKHKKTFDALHQIDEFVKRLTEDIKLSIQVHSVQLNQNNQIEVNFYYSINHSPAIEDYQSLPPIQKQYVNKTISQQFDEMKDFFIMNLYNYSKTSPETYQELLDNQNIDLSLTFFDLEQDIIKTIVTT